MSFVFTRELSSGLDSLDIEVPDSSYESLEVYFQELKKWSKKVNLIAKGATENEIVEKHFLDSLTLVPFLQGPSTHLLDIGTGAGFPGLVCKAALGENMKLTLVEPRLKRVSFLRHIVRSLHLTGVDIFPKRLEEVPQLTEEHFSHITCRAVTEIAPFMEMVSNYSGTGAQLICMKGPRWSEELYLGQRIIEESEYTLGRVIEHALPNSRVQRTLLFFDVNKQAENQ